MFSEDTKTLIYSPSIVDVSDNGLKPFLENLKKNISFDSLSATTLFINSTSQLLFKESPSLAGNLSTENRSVTGAAGVTPEPPLYIVVTTTLLYALIFVLGVAGNVLVITVVLRNTDMKNATNFFLVNLSVADLLILLVCMPTALIDIYAKEHWYFGEIMCKLVPFLEHCVALASVLTIIAISCERYYAICHPLRAHFSCTAGHMVRFVSVIWLTAGVAAAPFLYISTYRDSRLRDGTPIKVCRMPIKEMWQQVYTMLLTMVFFVIPFFFLTVVYILISRTLLGYSNKRDPPLHEMASSSLQKSKLKCRKQVTLMLLLVVVNFFICILPARCILVWAAFATRTDLMKLGFEGYLAVTYTARILMYLNSAVNPIIYNIISTKFQIAFRITLGLKIGRRKTNLPMSSVNLSRNATIRTRRRSSSNDNSVKVDVDAKTKFIAKRSNILFLNAREYQGSTINVVKFSRTSTCDLYS